MSGTFLNCRFSIALSLMAPLACATGGRGQSGDEIDRATLENPGLLKGREAAEYQEIQNLYSRGAFEAALTQAEVFEKKHPKSAQMAQVRNIHGLCFLLTRRPSLAIPEFRLAIELSPNDTYRQFVLYNLASAQVDAGLVDEAHRIASEIRADALDRETRAKYFSLRARIASRQKRHPDAVRNWLLMGRLIDPSQLRGGVSASLEEELKAVDSPASLEDLYREFDDVPLVEHLLFRLGTLEFGRGQMGSAETRLRALISRFPQSLHYAEATDLLNFLQSQAVVDGMTVGLLLPTKGRWETATRRTLQSIALAFKVFGNEEADVGVRLVVADSGETAESALKGLNELFFRHHVVAVIGPVLSRGVDQVTQRAQDLGLPIITLSQQPGITANYVIHGGITARLQAQEMAKYAVERLGMKRLAILFPKDNFGEQYSQYFWDAVEELGAQIVGFEGYPPNETDFRLPVDKLSGLHYTDARQRELNALVKERELNKVTKRTRKTEHLFALKPVVDYEGVFIPDAPEVVGQAIPHFAFRDVSGVRFLGTSSWNSPALVSRAERYAEGALFVDAFHEESSRPTARRFAARYQAAFGLPPKAADAVAYDVAAILDDALRTLPADRTRGLLRERLASTAGFSGVTGKITCREGNLVRALTVFVMRNGQVAEAR